MHKNEAVDETYNSSFFLGFAMKNEGAWIMW